MSKKEYMSKEQLYEGYKLIKKIDAPMGIKKRVFSELMGGYRHIWEVVGITKNALKRFKEMGFEKAESHGIQRAHINNRTDTYEHLLNNDLNIFDWWKFFLEGNKTILALKEENHKIKLIPKNEIFLIKKTDPDLFISSGFAWRHKEFEVAFLKQLYKDKING